MATTMKDIARAAGVSVKTVSNVVNGYEHVTQQVRARVELAIKQLDYRPNIAARNLRRGRSGLIALAIPSLVNPYYAELAQLLVETAERARLTVLVDCTGGDRDRERRVIDGFSTHLVDGLILCPHAATAADVRQRRASTPLVLLNERRLQVADSIAVDSRAVGQAATGHLIDIGRRRIAAIGMETRSQGPLPRRLRLEGYRQSLQTAGIPFDPELVVAAAQRENEEEEGARAVAELRARRPDVDAVFCFNDRLALAVMQQLLADGARVPEDVAVIGVDNISAGRFSTPTLSTVSPNTQVIADEAVRLLESRIAGGDSPGRHVVADFVVRPRQSTLGLDV